MPFLGIKIDRQTSTATPAPGPIVTAPAPSIPWAAIPPPTPAPVDLASFNAPIDQAERDLAAATAQVDDAGQAAQVVRDQIAALGGEPQPTDFDTAKAWSAAKDTWAFALAKVRPNLAPLEAEVNKAHAAMQLAGDHLADRRVILQRAVCENALADLDAAALHVVGKIRAYYATLHAISGTRREGLNLHDKRMILRGVLSQTWGDIERFDLSIAASVN